MSNQTAAETETVAGVSTETPARLGRRRAALNADLAEKWLAMEAALVDVCRLAGGEASPDEPPEVLAHRARQAVLELVREVRWTRKRDVSERPQAVGVACADCGAEMVRRERRSDGKPFFGCSRFPACRCTRTAGSRRRSDEFGGGSFSGDPRGEMAQADEDTHWSGLGSIDTEY